MTLVRVLVYGLMTLILGVMGAKAQDYPDKPIRIVVPFPPGSVNEIVARQIGDRLTKKLGQPVLIESVAGGAGSIGALKVAQAAPDGYTLLFPSSTIIVSDAVKPGQVDARKTLKPVTNAIVGPMGVFVNNDLPVKTIAEFIEYARAHPGEVRYGSSGVGSLTHLFGVVFADKAGLDMVHIPYPGGAPTITATVAGEVQMTIIAYGAAKPQVEGGQLKMLAIATDKRSPELPDVPTVDESGLPGYFASFWAGFFAPAGTPDAVVATLNRNIREVLDEPDFITAMQKLGYKTNGTTSAEFAAEIESDFVQWTEAVKSAGIEVTPAR